MQGLQQGTGGGRAEDETVAMAFVGGIDHGIRQSAGGTHHRGRAIAQAVQLVEAAGFEARGHDENVGPRLDAMGQRLVEADAHGALPLVLFRQRHEPLFQLM